MRDSHEIEEQMNGAHDIVMRDKTDVPGMSYEEGEENALRWALGVTDDKPIEK